MLNKQTIIEFFNVEKSDQKLLRVALVLQAFGFGLTTIVALLLRLPFVAPFLLLLVTIMSVLLIYIEAKTSEVRKICVIYLAITHLLIMPALSCFVPNSNYDFPIYFLIGIVFTAVLTRGKISGILIVCEILVDLFCFYHMYSFEKEPIIVPIDDAIVNTIGYFRIVLSITITGTLCGMLIAYRNYLLKRQITKSIEMQRQAENTNYAKDMFLVNVSHEIRTPLNAILGTTELVYDLDTTDKIQDSTFHIANASKALLSIMNDVMNFSNIDVGDSEKENEFFDLSEVLDDLINTFSIRYSDSNIEFFTRVNSDLPIYMKGNGNIEKQIILNVMTDCIKSMAKGALYLNVDYEPVTDDTIKLFISVEAKGDFNYSVKEKIERAMANEEDSNNELLFGRFYSIGGTSDIVEEDHRRVYSLAVVLEKNNDDRIASVDFAANKVLFYEHTEEQRNMLETAMESMKVPYVSAKSDEEFYTNCQDASFTHIMVAKEKYMDIVEKAKELLKPQSIIIIGDAMAISEESLIKTSFLRPVSCLSLNALFAQKKSSFIRNTSYKGDFVCPDANIMVVDDNLINLEVASGILKKYEANVTVAASGMECLNMLTDKHIDMIFLDYMMPEMDGIDTLKNIRNMDDEWLKQVPIIALTANAVSGAREMFISAGFDEYISKPIELDKMQKVLREKLPQGKIQYVTE